MKSYKSINFNYPINRVKIVWNCKHRFDIYTIDSVGIESFLESQTHYIKNNCINKAQTIANKLAS